MKKNSQGELFTLQLISKYRNELMGFAAIWILIFHNWNRVFDNYHDQLYLLFWMERFGKRIGFVGVDLFFAISGMGVFLSLQKNEIKTFYSNRLKRILLPWIVTGVMYALVEAWSIKQFVMNITGLFWCESIYEFLWFVPAIMLLYLVSPLYNHFFMKAENKLLFTANGILVWLLMSTLLQNILRGDLWGITNRIPIYLTGFLLGYYIKNQPFALTRQIRFMALAAGLLGLVLAYLTNFKDYYVLVPTSNCCVPNYLITIGILIWGPLVFHILPDCILGFFRKLGAVSLELYCVQELFRDVWLQHTGFSSILLNNIIIMILCVLGAFILSLLQKVTKGKKTGVRK